MCNLLYLFALSLIILLINIFPSIDGLLRNCYSRFPMNLRVDADAPASCNNVLPLLRSYYLVSFELCSFNGQRLIYGLEHSGL